MGIAPTTPEHRRAVEANLFPAALPAVEPWDKFGWHGLDTAQEHSSQALAIDVFGTLQQSPYRDAIAAALATRWGLPSAGPWEVKLETRDPDNWLCEKPGRTEVDVGLFSPHVVIFCECKFTEADGGTCSQLKKISKGAHKGLIQCNGHYAMQTNPANGLTASCALTAKGIRYWEVIPQVFDFAATEERHPCPFAGGWFQWMRNLTTVAEVAGHSGRRAAFGLVYADGPGLSIAKKIEEAAWQDFLGHSRPESIMVNALAYQELIRLALTVVQDDPTWLELETWVKRKITNVGQR